MVIFNNIIKEYNKHANELILDDFVVKRLIGAYYGEDDYYWIYLDIKKGLELISCLCKWIPLKEKIEDTEYNRIEILWKLNFYLDYNSMKRQLLILKRKSRLNRLN